MLQANKLNFSRIFELEILEILLLDFEFLFGKNTRTNQFEKATRCCLHIGGGIVRFGERFIKKIRVQFG